MDDWARRLSESVSLLNDLHRPLELQGLIAHHAAERVAGLTKLRNVLFTMLDYCGAPPACYEELIEALELLGLHDKMNNDNGKT